MNEEEKYRRCPHCGSTNTKIRSPENAANLDENMDERECNDCGGVFWAGKRKKGKYQCPHCESWHTFFYAPDADMGVGNGWDVYKCEDCGRYFDEPYEGYIGLRRD